MDILSRFGVLHPRAPAFSPFAFHVLYNQKQLDALCPV